MRMYIVALVAPRLLHILLQRGELSKLGGTELCMLTCCLHVAGRLPLYM
jgi:hypothetical protein